MTEHLYTVFSVSTTSPKLNSLETHVILTRFLATAPLFPRGITLALIENTPIDTKSINVNSKALLIVFLSLFIWFRRCKVLYVNPFIRILVNLQTKRMKFAFVTSRFLLFMRNLKNSLIFQEILPLCQPRGLAECIWNNYQTIQPLRAVHSCE